MSNIILHELDAKLEERGHRFVRYADDCSIYLRSMKSAHRVMASISVYLETCLKLKVNVDKSKVSRPSQSNLLGFSFYGSKEMWKMRIASKSLRAIKEKIREQTKGSQSVSLHQRITKLREIIHGWVNFLSGYCRPANSPTLLTTIDKKFFTGLGLDGFANYCYWKTTHQTKLF